MSAETTLDLATVSAQIQDMIMGQNGVQWDLLQAVCRAIGQALRGITAEIVASPDFSVDDYAQYRPVQWASARLQIQVGGQLNCLKLSSVDPATPLTSTQLTDLLACIDHVSQSLSGVNGVIVNVSTILNVLTALKTHFIALQQLISPPTSSSAPISSAPAAK